MIQAEDGSWVPDGFYGGGMVQAEDGSWVPASFYGDQSLAERVSDVEGQQDNLARRRTVEQPNLRDLRDVAATKVTAGQVLVYSSATGRWEPADPAGTTSAPPQPIAPSATAAEGSGVLARANHIHGALADVPVSVGQANAQGSSDRFARADHVHAGPLLPHIEVKRATDQSIPNNLTPEEFVKYDTIVEDEGSGYSLITSGTHQWKLQVLAAGAGRCLIHGANKWEFNAAGTRMAHWMHTPIATGVADEVFDHHASGYCSPGSTEVTNMVARPLRLAAGDMLHCVVYQDSGGARVIEADAYTYPFLSITRIGA